MLPASAATAATAAPRPGGAARHRHRHAADDERYAPPEHHALAVPDARTRNVLSRFTGAVTADRIADVAAVGGIDAWFEQQLVPAAIPDAAADQLASWWPNLWLSPAEKWARLKNGTLSAWQTTQDNASWMMNRRLITKRQVEETMVDFWSNLLHVASSADYAWILHTDYLGVLRSHALGRFDDILQAAIKHPAMGLFLDNVESTASAVNENLGRELLECHTVGADAGYSQRDVVNSSRILTGFKVDVAGTWDCTYVPERHWVGRVKVMGFSSSNSRLDGRPTLTNYLSYLAHHPLTARRLCTRLAVRFVGDEPSAGLVDMLTNVYLASDTDITPVLRALVASAEFTASAMLKTRTPVEDAVATMSVLRAQVAQPKTPADAANQLIFVSGAAGQVLFTWPTPDAFPDVASAWTGAGRMLGSMKIHWYAVNGNWPSAGVTYRKPMDWLPQLPTMFSNVVDYVVRSTLFMPCTATMLKAACVATDCRPTEIIDEMHPLTTYRFPCLLVSILDSPEHYSR